MSVPENCPVIEQQTKTFDGRITLGNILTMVTLLGTLVGGFFYIKTALESQGAAILRIENAQSVMAGRMDNWYERLVILEERDRERRNAVTHR